MLLEILDLPSLIALSGYRQKTAIIKWLNLNPDILLSEGLIFNGNLNAYGLPIVTKAPITNINHKINKSWKPNLK
jgi:hypothetical protein